MLVCFRFAPAVRFQDHLSLSDQLPGATAGRWMYPGGGKVRDSGKYRCAQRYPPGDIIAHSSSNLGSLLLKEKSPVNVTAIKLE